MLVAKTNLKVATAKNMPNLERFKTLLEMLVLVLTLSTQHPLLGIVAAVGAIYFMVENGYDDTGNN